METGLFEMAKRAKQRATRQAVPPVSALEILQRPGISPEELYRLNVMPVSRNGIYEACKRGEIENFRMGKKIIITTAALRRKFGIGAD
jgi:hypothetical protein